ncbi:MAG: hypothetical protein AAF560_15300 [Acidobacteriota bacterium]
MKPERTLSTILHAVAWSGLLAVFGCGPTEIPQSWIEPPPDPPQRVAEGEAPGSPAWLQVDATLREQGDLGSYGDLRAGLDELGQHFHVTIKDSGARWSVNLWPHSDEGHDYSFGVVKETGEMVDTMIGSIFPPPD